MRKDTQEELKKSINNMTRIIPAILEKNLRGVVSKLKKVKPYFNLVQIDIVDGVYVANTTFPYKEPGVMGEDFDIKEITEFGIDFEIDGMTTEHVSAARFWKNKGAKKYILHTAASLTYIEDIKNIKSMGMNVSIALLPNDTIETVDKTIDLISGVQCMGIDQVGVQGRPFDKRVLELVSNIKHKYPTLEVNVDGSVNKDTLESLVKAGTDTFSIGSALLSGDIEENKRELENIIQSKDYNLL